MGRDTYDLWVTVKHITTIQCTPYHNPVTPTSCPTTKPIPHQSKSYNTIHNRYTFGSSLQGRLLWHVRGKGQQEIKITMLIIICHTKTNTCVLTVVTTTLAQHITVKNYTQTLHALLNQGLARSPHNHTNVTVHTNTTFGTVHTKWIVNKSTGIRTQWKHTQYKKTIITREHKSGWKYCRVPIIAERMLNKKRACVNNINVKKLKSHRRVPASAV